MRKWFFKRGPNGKTLRRDVPFFIFLTSSMTSLLDDFEKDCLVRIEHRASSKSRPFEEICIQESQNFPSATYFLMGMGFGVIAARVACTCIFTPPSVSNE
jgi:hypothetical protein